MRLRGGVLAVVIVAACKIGPGIDSRDDSGGTKTTGAMCADSKECASGACDVEGYCGQPGCSDARPCPGGWTCKSYSTIFTSGSYCDPPCSACPAGLNCEGGAGCTRPKPEVTIPTTEIHAKQPVSFDLTIDANSRGPYEVTWAIVGVGYAGSTTPLTSGTGTHVTVTFPKSGAYRLTTTIKGGGLKDESVDTPIPVCGEDGDACGDSGGCCGGECVFGNRVGGGECALKCPASCRPGRSCRAFDNTFAGSGFPRGELCLPDPAVLTIDMNPAAPKVKQPITFTGHAVSPAGLKIISERWYLDDFGIDKAQGSTYVLTSSFAEFHHVTYEVYDDAQQVTKKTVDVNITE